MSFEKIEELMTGCAVIQKQSFLRLKLKKRNVKIFLLKCQVAAKKKGIMQRIITAQKVDKGMEKHVETIKKESEKMRTWVKIQKHMLISNMKNKLETTQELQQQSLEKIAHDFMSRDENGQLIFISFLCFCCSACV